MQRHWIGVYFPTQSYEVAGKDKKWLRRVANMGKKGVVKELVADVDDDQVRAISDAWRSTKQIKTRELKLMTRPPVFGDEWGFGSSSRSKVTSSWVSLLRSVFHGWSGRRLYDQYYSREAWCEARWWQDFLVLEVMKKLKAEGVPYLAPGLSPLHAMEESKGESKLALGLKGFITTARSSTASSHSAFINNVLRSR